MSQLVDLFRFEFVDIRCLKMNQTLLSNLCEILTIKSEQKKTYMIIYKMSIRLKNQITQFTIQVASSDRFPLKKWESEKNHFSYLSNRKTYNYETWWLRVSWSLMKNDIKMKWPICSEKVAQNLTPHFFELRMMTLEK